MRLISAAELTKLLPISSAIPLMREAFPLISSGAANVAERQAIEVAQGTGLLMGAALDSKGIAAKLVSVMPGNQSKKLPGSIGLVLLMDDETGTPLALMDGSSLTAIRTAALNACAIDLLSRPDSETALLIGCGTQGAAQLAGLSEVRSLRQIRVMGRHEGKTSEFVDKHQSRVDAELCVAMDQQAAMQGVDIIVAATNSLNPVIHGKWVPEGCHVSGVGSFKQGMCEFDSELLSKASIFVEKRETASSEAGELMTAVSSGISKESDWSEIGEVITGQRPGRQSHQEITYFKSVGHAVFDLLAARAVWKAAVEQGVGQDWSP